MKFEEAISELRKGAKIRHPTFADDEYLMVCRVGLEGESIPFDEKPLSIVKMKGDHQADEMIGRLNYVAKIKRQLKKILSEEDYKKYHNIYTEMDISQIFDNNIFAYPQLNLLLIMSDDWEVINEVIIHDC